MAFIFWPATFLAILPFPPDIKIIVHESNGIRGFGRKQKIEIYFNFIGQFIPPIPEEEIREEAGTVIG